MATELLVDYPPALRSFLMIQNQGTTTLGICFDGPQTTLAACPIALVGGASVTFDQTVPQNRVYGVNETGSDIFVGVTLANTGA